MTALVHDHLDGATDFAALVQRLVTASERTAPPWQRVVREASESRAEVAETHLPDWDPLADLFDRCELIDRCPDLALQRQLAFYTTGMDLETLLRRGLERIHADLPARDPARSYIRFELAEEAAHSAMFQWYVDFAGRGLERHSSISSEEIERFTTMAASAPPVFLFYVLCGEHVFDRVQRAALLSPSTHPVVAVIDRLHRREEARHLSFARGFLQRCLDRSDRKVRRRLTYEAPLIARWTCARVIGLPPSLRGAAGLEIEDEQIARLAVQSDLGRMCMSELHRVCESTGLTDPRLEGAWQIDDAEPTGRTLP